MNGRQHNTTIWWRKCLLASGLLWVACGIGCSDPRISLKEFLELQEEARLASIPTTQPTMSQDEAKQLVNERLGRYRVGQGDVVSVQLTEVTGLVAGTNASPTRVRVDRHGEIMLPLVGALKVEGMELEDIEDLVTDAYVPKVYREASVFVDIVSMDTTDVVVRGAVGGPGLVQLRRTEANVLYALVASSGLTDFASGEVTLQRLRQPGSVQRLSIADAEGLREALQAEPLEDGDIITVEAAPQSTFFVGGLVGRGGPQAYPPGVPMTILQVLAAAGGVRTDMLIKEATLTRRFPDGRDVRVKLNLNRLANGKDPNIELAPGDILWVNHTVSTWVQEWINSHIFLRGGASVSASFNASGIEWLNRKDYQKTGGGGGQDMESSFDPFGFLQRGVLLNQAAGQ